MQVMVQECEIDAANRKVEFIFCKLCFMSIIHKTKVYPANQKKITVLWWKNVIFKKKAWLRLYI